MQEARRRGAELGAVPIGPGGGAVLRFLTASISARAVVEIGTGAGVSGIYLIRGMAPDGVLTSIDVEAEHQRVARESYAAAGIAPARARLITGRALDVLPRLTEPCQVVDTKLRCGRPDRLGTQYGGKQAVAAGEKQRHKAFVVVHGSQQLTHRNGLRVARRVVGHASVP